MKNFESRLRNLEQTKAFASGCKVALCPNTEKKEEYLKEIYSLHNSGLSKEQKLIVVLLHPKAMPNTSEGKDFYYDLTPDYERQDVQEVYYT